MKYIYSSKFIFFLITALLLIAIVFPVLPNRHIYFLVDGKKHQINIDDARGRLFLTTSLAAAPYTATRVKLAFDMWPQQEPDGAFLIQLLKVSTRDGTDIFTATNIAPPWTRLGNGQYSSVYYSPELIPDNFDVQFRVKPCLPCMSIAGKYLFSRKTNWEFLSILDILNAI